MKHDDMLARIIANPESDSARLAFADSIEPEDPEWASHVREAVARPNTVASVELVRRILGPLSGTAVRVCMERGFVSHISMTSKEFIARGAEWMSMCPVYGLTIDNSTSKDIDVLLKQTSLLKVRELGYFPSIDSVQLSRILSAPTLVNVVRLKVTRTASLDEILASRMARQLMEWPFLRAEDRPVGDRSSVAIIRRGFNEYDQTTYLPMPPEDRALEEKYGYLPALHSANWQLSTLDVMQGKGPAFPVGARPCEAMYEVGPPTEVHSGIVT